MTTKRLKAALAIVSATVLLPLIAAEPAYAVDPFAGDCRNRPSKHIIFKYDAHHPVVPLRCGWHSNITTLGIGYDHIKRRHGFNRKTHRNIKWTFAIPDCIFPAHEAADEPGRHVWAFERDDRWHRVVFSGDYREAYNGRVGIITAYWSPNKPGECD